MIPISGIAFGFFHSWLNGAGGAGGANSILAQLQDSGKLCGIRGLGFRFLFLGFSLVCVCVFLFWGGGGGGCGRSFGVGADGFAYLQASGGASTTSAWAHLWLPPSELEP